MPDTKDPGPCGLTVVENESLEIRRRIFGLLLF